MENTQAGKTTGAIGPTVLAVALGLAFPCCMGLCCVVCTCLLPGFDRSFRFGASMIIPLLTFPHCTSVFTTPGIIRSNAFCYKCLRCVWKVSGHSHDLLWFPYPVFPMLFSLPSCEYAFISMNVFHVHSLIYPRTLAVGMTATAAMVPPLGAGLCFHVANQTDTGQTFRGCTGSGDSSVAMITGDQSVLCFSPSSKVPSSPAHVRRIWRIGSLVTVKLPRQLPAGSIPSLSGRHWMKCRQLVLPAAVKTEKWYAPQLGRTGPTPDQF